MKASIAWLSLLVGLGTPVFIIWLAWRGGYMNAATWAASVVILSAAMLLAWICLGHTVDTTVWKDGGQ